MYRFNAIEISMVLFTDLEKYPKICTDPQKIPNSQNNSEKNKARGIILLDLKACHKAIAIQYDIVTKIGTCNNKIESPEIKPCIYS